MKNLRRVVIPFHFLAIAGVAWSAYSGQWQILLAATLVFWIVWGIGFEVGTHGLFSPSAFKASPAVHKVLAVLATLVGQGTVVFWVAVHRGYHHPHADTERDPHSPK